MDRIFIISLSVLIILSGCSRKDAVLIEPASLSPSSLNESGTASGVKTAEPSSKIDNTPVLNDNATFLNRLEILFANDKLFENEQGLSWSDAANWVLSQGSRDLRKEAYLSGERYGTTDDISGINHDIFLLTAVGSSIKIAFFSIPGNCPVAALRIDADILNPNSAISISEIFEEFGESQVVTLAKDTPPKYDKSPFFEYKYSNLRIRFVLDEDNTTIKYILIRPMHHQTGSAKFVPVHDFSEYLFSDDISSLTFEEIEQWFSMPLEDYLSMFDLFLGDTVYGRVPGATISGGSYYSPPISGFIFVSNLENTALGIFFFFEDIKSLVDENIIIGTHFAKIIDIWGEPYETEKKSISYVRGKLLITFFSEYSEDNPVYDALIVSVNK